MNTVAQNRTLERIGHWLVLGECDGDVWLCRQSRLCKVFSRVDVKGGLYVESRKSVVVAFGKAEAIRLVDAVFGL